MEEREKWIGLFCARLFEENNIRFIQELQKQGQRENYRIMIFSLDTCVEEDTENVPAELELIRLSQYISLDAGIILAESIKNYALLEHIARIMHVKEVPCFCIERQIEGCYCLFHTEETGFEPMVRHVIQDHGARKINMLAGFKNNLYSQMRIEQYKKVLAENGIPFEEERLGYGDFGIVLQEEKCSVFSILICLCRMQSFVRMMSWRSWLVICYMMQDTVCRKMLL